MTRVSSWAAEGPSLFSLFKVALPGVTFKVLILPQLPGLALMIVNFY